MTGRAQTPMAIPLESARHFCRGAIPLLPGLGLALAVALAASACEPLLRQASGGTLALPAMVIALAIGILLNGVAARPIFAPGIGYAVKSLLRYAIALLGVRVALADLLALGPGTAVLVPVAMLATVVAGLALARLLGRSAGYGALAGAATAVCGASAALATASVLPEYKGRNADIAFTVVMANGVSTLVMLAYPPLCLWLGLSPAETGVLLGLTIHDMAQVVGAGYAVSEPVGNSAVVVKLFRVFLLLPVVVLIGAGFARGGAGTMPGRQIPVPGFALAFLGLGIINSILPATPLAGLYAPAKQALSALSGTGLLLSIAALGLGTSIGEVVSVGWRHVVVFAGTSLLLLALALGGLMLLR
jgi:uncharacterized integral membrane protein (TIGR00698 family)